MKTVELKVARIGNSRGVRIVTMTHSNDARMPGIEFGALVRAAILERR